MSTRAALYFRQSLDVQEGIDRQRARCMSLAEARGWTVVAEYVDNDTSATKPRGPKTSWGKMIEAAKAGSFDVVIAVDMDRLLRSIGDLAKLIEIGVMVTTVDGEIDLTTADGEFRATMLAGVARFEVRRKSERQARAAVKRLADGIPQAGKRPFGYETDRMTLRESEAVWVRYMHEAVLSGVSLHAIARKLNSEGVLTSQTGGQWQTTQVRSILLRVRNAGRLVSHGVVQSTSQIQPLVSLEDHEAVMAILAGRSYTRGPKVTKNVLSGLLKCGVCGSPMTGKNVTAKGAREPFYICSAPRASAGERHTSIAARLIEPHVTELLIEALMNRLDNPPEESKADTLELARLHAEGAEIRRQKGVVQQLALMPGADLTHAQTTLQRLSDHEQSLSMQLTELTTRNAELALVGPLENIVGDIESNGWLGFMDEPEMTERARFRHDQLNEVRARFIRLETDKKRALIRGLLDLTVGNGKGVKRVRVG